MFFRVLFGVLAGLILFCSSCSNSISGNNDINAAYSGAENGEFDPIIEALDNGLKVDQPDKDGLTLLHHAVLGNQDKMVMKLIEEYKANVNVKDKEGATPLTYAKDEQNEAIVSILTTAGAKE